jgi:hypothetical protein
MEGMTQRTLRIPGTLKHTGDEQTDANLQEKAREHVDRHPGLHFLADVLRALHGPLAPLRNVKTFFAAFPPREVMDALAQRPDLRVKALKPITGSPPTLLRRLSSEGLAAQIDLLAIEDLPESERSVRPEADRALSVHELYFKYLDPTDLATYVPAQTIWKYESQDDWWKWEPSAGGRVLMAAELRSIRRHLILTDTEILDLLGDETLERHLPLAVRVALRGASRRAAAAGRPFTDADLFAGAKGSGGRDLIDEMVESVPMPQLRAVIGHVATMLGFAAANEADDGPTVVTSAASAIAMAMTAADAAAVPTPVGVRVGPKPAPGGPVTPGPVPILGKKGPPAAPPSGRPMPPPPTKAQPAKGPVATTAEAEGPPQPDDDLAFLEELSGRVG